MSNKDKSNLFDALSKYAPLQKRNPQEDFLTELFAWLLKNVSGLKRSYIEFLEGEYYKQHNGNGTMDLPPFTDENIDIETQVFITNNEKNGFIDLRISIDKKPIFACEHKIDSDVHDNQIERYKEDSNYTVLITRTPKQLKSKQAEVADIKIQWKYIKGWAEKEALEMEKQGDSAVHTYLLRKFAEYLDFDKVEPIKEEQLCLDGKRKIKSDEDLYKTLDYFLRRFCEEEVEKLKTECDVIADAYGIEKRYEATNSRWVWGRKGIDFFGRGWEDKPESEGETQSPLGLFAGILYDPGKRDHYWDVEDEYLEPKGIDVVVVLDVTNSEKNSMMDKDAYTQMKEEMHPDNIGAFNRLILGEDIPNKWRLAILRKPLKDVLFPEGKTHYETENAQYEMIRDTIISGIKLLSEALQDRKQTADGDKGESDSAM